MRSAKAVRASASATELAVRARPNVDPSATVIMKSKIFILAIVRLPERRRNTTSETYIGMTTTRMRRIASQPAKK
jgi:hypothetical protein